MEEFRKMMSRQKPRIALKPVAVRLAVLGLVLIAGIALVSRAANLLQQTSVQTVGWLLGVFYRVHADGLRLLLCGQNILPDRPQSSAMAAFVLLAFFLWLAWVRRPSYKQAVMGFWVTLFMIYATNVSRIFILAAGSAFPNLVGHVDVSLPLWHDLISGLSLLFAGLLPLGVWAMSWHSPTHLVAKTMDEALDAPCQTSQLPARKSGGRVKVWLACSLVALVLTLCSSPTTLHSGRKIESASGRPFSMVFYGSGFHPPSLRFPGGNFASRNDAQTEKHRLVSFCRIDAQSPAFTRQEKGGQHAGRSPRKARTRYC